jgi:hypothetical protein
MELNIFEVKKHIIAEIKSEEIVINDTQDVLDVMANASYQGARSIILYEEHLRPEFFELRTGLAGEILQKFSNYRMKLAIIGAFEKYKSKSLKAFIGESNRGNQIFFVPDRDAAIAKITG